jgi:hypothetical protein
LPINAPEGEFVRSKYFCGLILTLLVLAIFASCRSTKNNQPDPDVFSNPVDIQQPESPSASDEPPVISSRRDNLVPFTKAMWQRINESRTMPKDVREYQFVLSGWIMLETQTRLSDEMLLEGGRVRFEDIDRRNKIIINDQTEGLALEWTIIGTETVFSVCFENDQKYRLNFVHNSRDPDEYFYLKYSPVGLLSQYSDEKGRLDYGGEMHTLKYSGIESPYLLIRLAHEESIRESERIVPGRRVGD